MKPLPAPSIYQQNGQKPIVKFFYVMVVASDPAKQGEILGVNQSASALARILGPMLAITLFYVLPSHILPYLIGTGLMGIALLLSFRIGHD